MARERHYVVPQSHPQRPVVGGPVETITVYVPACNHSGYQVNGTTQKDDVTCKRCKTYLARVESWEKERTRPRISTSDMERLMLDVICDRCEGFAGMRSTLTTLIGDNPAVYSALLGVLRDDV